MRRFAALMERLSRTPGRGSKVRLLCDHFSTVPDPDRGWALAALTGALSLRTVKPGLLRALATERTDSELFALSYDYVGDLAETVSLIWPGRGDQESRLPRLGEVVELLANASPIDAPRIVEGLLDALPPSERFALIKLVTGGMRIGVSERLAKQALADFGGSAVTEVEELWHGLQPPYQALFAWLEGGPKPQSIQRAPFRPAMLATRLEEGDIEKLRREDFAAEWKWDGVRIQAVADRGERRLYTRTGEDISASFPDVIEHMGFAGALDGELLIRRPEADDSAGSFSELQQRLNRKKPPRKLIESHPAFVRAYDLLSEGGEDLRLLTYEERRLRLNRFLAALEPSRFDLSPEVSFADWEELDRLRATPPYLSVEGIVLKRRDSPYTAGRTKGPWFKWKREPFRIDAVLMYAQRGHGKRSSFYSDYTFGVWTETEELTPVGKAYFGFTDEELREIDRFVRTNTVERYGPVRAVRADQDVGLVLEIAFEGLNRSARHKSGVAMRFPRISRLRRDKPPIEADRLDTLRAMLASEGSC
jgi:DNA ligase-1